MTGGPPPDWWLVALACAVGHPIDLDGGPLLDGTDPLAALDLQLFIQGSAPNYQHRNDEHLASLTARDVAYYCGYEV